MDTAEFGFGVRIAHRVKVQRNARLAIGEDPFRRARQQKIVRIKEHHKFAVRFREARIEARALPAVDRQQDRNQPVSIRLDHVPRIVGRAIVYNDQLDCFILRQDIFNRSGKISGVIVVRDDDGQGRCGRRLTGVRGRQRPQPVQNPCLLREH